MRAARLTVYQEPRNPSERERMILALLAGGRTQKEAAVHLGLKPHSITNALGHMRDRYATQTNEALVALAVRLQWITLAIDCVERDLLESGP